MRIEWATLVKSVEGDGMKMVVKGPGADNIQPPTLPALIKIWVVASLAVNFHELQDPQESTLQVIVQEPSEMTVVSKTVFRMESPKMASTKFEVGHTGRVIKKFEIIFTAETSGWYSIQFALNGGSSYLLDLRVAS